MIVENIGKYLKTKGISPSSCEKNIGVSNGTISKPLNQNTTIKTNTLEKFLIFYPDVNPTWLFTGEGNMLINSNQDYQQLDSKINLVNETNNSYNQLNKLPNGAIPFYDLPVSAGRSLFDIEGAMKPDGYIKDIPGVANTEAFLPVHGISMYPEVKEGAIIGVREANKIDSLNTQHKYLIITREDRMVKYIDHDKEDNDILWCKSPNYGDFKIYKEDIIEVHRITFVMNPE